VPTTAPGRTWIKATDPALTSAPAPITGGALITELLRRRAGATALGCLASTVHQTCEALVPLAIGLAVEHAVDGGSPARIMIAVGLLLLLFAVLATGGGVAFWVLNSTSLRAAHDLRVRAVGRILADPSVGRDRRPGELMNILTTDTKATADVLRVLGNLVSGAAGLSVAVVVLVRIEPFLGLGILLVVITLVLGINRLGPRLERRARARQQAGGLAAALAAELVQALRPLRGFGGVPEATRRYRQASRQSLDTALGTASASALIAATGLLASGAVLVGTAAAAGTMALSGRISLGEFVTVVVMTSFVAEPVQRVTDGVQRIALCRAGADRVAALLTPPSSGPSHDSAGRPGPLRVRDVTLGPITGLDLTLRPGELLGIATTDPAIADTITDLLAGRRAPERGEVGFGDVGFGEVALGPPAGSPGGSRRHLLAEPHVAQLLGRSLAEVMDSDRGPVRMKPALAAAGAEDVLVSLGLSGSDGSEGLDGSEGELLDGGSNLSGGQRQRIALARALAAEAPVLLLRDPLTAVDAATEDRVAEGLRAWRAGNSAGTIIVTTSPPLLSRCDRVLFLGAGRPPVTATHRELVADSDYAETVLR
jgi:putative ABC transport system ATP-binding protein